MEGIVLVMDEKDYISKEVCEIISFFLFKLDSGFPISFIFLFCVFLIWMLLFVIFNCYFIFLCDRLVCCWFGCSVYNFFYCHLVLFKHTYFPLGFIFIGLILNTGVSF